MSKRKSLLSLVLKALVFNRYNNKRHPQRFMPLLRRCYYQCYRFSRNTHTDFDFHNSKVHKRKPYYKKTIINCTLFSDLQRCLHTFALPFPVSLFVNLLIRFQTQVQRPSTSRIRSPIEVEIR